MWAGIESQKAMLFASIKIKLCLIGLLAFFWMPETGAQTKDFTVVIDAGHGGKDPGARGSQANEKAINLQVALNLGRLIEEKHPEVKVIYTRKDDRFIELNERADIANRNKADLFISIHVNSLKRGSGVRGAETYTLGLAKTDENLQVAMRENSAILLEDNYEQKYEGFDPNSSESYIIFEFMQNMHVEQSIHFASEVQKSFASAGRVDRGVRQAGFLVLRKTSMPSVLIELGFISNSSEEKFLRSKAGQETLAKSISNAFDRYKRTFDNRQSGVAHQAASASAKKGKAEKTQSEQLSNAGQVVYKIQILTSDKKLQSGSRYFKGYKNVSFFQEKGLYKYTYGESSDFDEIMKLWRKVRRDFKDAFIVSFKDGKRVK